MKSKALVILGIAMAVLALWAPGGVMASSLQRGPEGDVILAGTVRSYVWISGNDIRKGSEASTTDVRMDSFGGAKVYSGATTGSEVPRSKLRGILASFRKRS